MSEKGNIKMVAENTGGLFVKPLTFHANTIALRKHPRGREIVVRDAFQTQDGGVDFTLWRTLELLNPEEEFISETAISKKHVAIAAAIIFAVSLTVILHYFF